MRIGLSSDEPTREWFACCTDADWSKIDPRDGKPGLSCNWYGEYRETEAQAKSDAARHRRTHAEAHVVSDTGDCWCEPTTVRVPGKGVASDGR